MLVKHSSGYENSAVFLLLCVSVHEALNGILCSAYVIVGDSGICVVECTFPGANGWFLRRNSVFSN